MKLETIKVNKFIANESLVGKYLVSTPAISDNRFYKSVILITKYDASGSMGIVLNKPSAHQFLHIIKNINAQASNDLDLSDHTINIVLGGPYSPSNLFIVHSNDYNSKDTIKISNHLNMTNQPSVVLDLANKKGPLQSYIAIGCSSWEANQLEKELLSNDWLVYDDIHSIIFNYSNSNLNKMHSDLTNKLGLGNISLAKFAVDTKVN